MAFFMMDSSRSQELARRLKEVIEAYRREHPDLSRREIRCATRRALHGETARFAVIGLAAGGLAFLIGTFAYLQQSARSGAAEFPLVPFVILVIAFVVWVFLVRLR